LAEIVQPNKKIVSAWAVEADFDPKTLKSNLFEVDRPEAGKPQLFPEVDCAELFALQEAPEKILAGQLPVPQPPGACP